MRFFVDGLGAMLNIGAKFRGDEALDVGGLVGQLDQRDLAGDTRAAEGGDDGVDA